MLINFCHPCLDPLLSCDTICCDGYEITNLIAIDSCQQKGFLAGSFMKPPVTITVKLICDINLSHIVIHPTVGAQKSVGFEIYASQEFDATIAEQQLLSLGYIQNSEDCVVFSSKENLYKTSPIAEKIPVSKHFFFGRVHSFVKRVRVLAIKVTKTLQSSVPSLKSIEIWGQPSRNCDPATRLRIENLWRGNMQETSGQPQQLNIYNQNSSPEGGMMNESESRRRIPEEFIDLITYSIMTMPMLLPSGKVVDCSTLEKCAKVDAEFGRVPGDPFTGESFTDLRKPTFFAALKLQIDKFLSDNPDHKEVCKIPRILGKRERSDNIIKVKEFGKTSGPKNIAETAVHSLHHPSTPGALAAHYSHHSASINKTVDTPVNVDSGSKCSSQSARFCSESRKCVNSGLKKSDVRVICIDECDSEEVIDISDDCTGLKHNFSKNVYASASHNVDDILQKTLVTLPSFLNPVSDKTTKIEECNSCSIRINLYCLPCGHFLCRACLLLCTEDSQVVCRNCRLEFSSSEPTRFHR